MVLTTDQPQAYSNRPRSVSPLNNVATSAVSLALFGSAMERGAHLRVGLAAGDGGQVPADEPVGVGLGLVAGVHLLTGVALEIGELRRAQRRAALGGKRDVLGVELGVDHVQPEMAPEEQQPAADTQDDVQDHLDHPAGGHETEHGAPRRHHGRRWGRGGV